MTINPNAVGATYGPARRAWDSRDTMLYALGVGAGVDELTFTTENSRGVELQALPSFAVIIASAANGLAGIGDFDWGNLVHGAQSMQVHHPIPVDGAADVSGRVTAIDDKGAGKNAVVELTTEAMLAGIGEPLLTTRSTLVIKGAGGFGGERRQGGERVVLPERAPDHEVTQPSLPTQALLYRLSGDRNPLHSDPWFATERAGLPRPILHGLCTYGFAGRALLHRLCQGVATRFGGMECRFSAVVFPGDTLTTHIWEGDGGALFQTSASPDGRTVLAEGRFHFAAG